MAIAALQKLLSLPYEGPARFQVCRSLLRSFSSIPCSIRCGMIRTSKNSSFRPRPNNTKAVEF